MTPINQAPETRPSLILRLQKPGDVQAWREFVEIYGPVIRAMAEKRRLQAADVDDITQEVFTRVAHSISSWDPDPAKGSFRSWLATITRNLVIQSFRNRVRLPATGLESADIASAEDNEFEMESEQQLFLWAARRIQSRFEAKTWRAFWLTAVEGYDVTRVADDLQTTKAQVYVARSRVMRLLKETIQRTQFDSFDEKGLES